MPSWLPTAGGGGRAEGGGAGAAASQETHAPGQESAWASEHAVHCEEASDRSAMEQQRKPLRHG